MAFIKENAARLKKADDLWQKANDVITQYEDEKGEAISSFVRKKIKAIGSNVSIKTIRGMGYRMEI